MTPAPQLKQLAVWLHGRHVADLKVDSERSLSLIYTTDAVETFGIGTLCLSVALPVVKSRYGHAQVFPWAEGMLPEGETRTVLERRFRVRRGDTFGLLAAIGRDCAGAVTFLEPGEELEAPSTEHALLSDDQIDAAISELPSRPLGADEDVRVSLGGIQAKLLLTKTAAGWSRPAPGAPSTHILKPEPLEYPGLVAAEAFVLRAARNYGLPSAEVELAKIGGKNVLIVTRFDRNIDFEGRVTRIHQEDGGQALSLDPSDMRAKYQYSGDVLPNLSSLAEVLRTHSTNPVRDLLRLLEMTTIHIAVGNTDAHVRNHGFMHANGGISLSPLYDAAPTWKFAKTRRVALWIDSQMMLSEITPDHLIRESTKWGFPTATATRAVIKVLNELPDAIDRAASETTEVDPEIVEVTQARIRAMQNRWAA
jgi:serine/threonine-protein kinase HipA